MIVTATNVTVSGRTGEPDGGLSSASGGRTCRACCAAPLIPKSLARRLKLGWRVEHEGNGLCSPCHQRHRRAGTLWMFPRVRPPARSRCRERRSWRNADLVAEVRFLRAQGLTLAEAAARLGMRPDSIERAFLRAGLPGGARCGL